MDGGIVSSRQAWENPLFLELHPSRHLCLVFISIHLLTVIVLIPMSIPLWLQLGTALGVLVNLRYVLRRYVLFRSPRAVQAIHWNQSEGWSLIAADGEVYMVDMLAGTSVLGPLVILHCRSRGMIYDFGVPVLADMLDEAGFRRLRARLRWGSAPDTDLPMQHGK